MVRLGELGGWAARVQLQQPGVKGRGQLNEGAGDADLLGQPAAFGEAVVQRQRRHGEAGGANPGGNVGSVAARPRVAQMRLGAR